ncbi:MAG TPA: hypothetical protein VGQ67_14865, partial [Candidatus Polarisedimenticolia bacterium]|nr:hypothetical protein [Candidatus Polarisedimenticolia bacterium]
PVHLLADLLRGPAAARFRTERLEALSQEIGDELAAVALGKRSHLRALEEGMDLREGPQRRGAGRP